MKQRIFEPISGWHTRSDKEIGLKPSRSGRLANCKKRNAENIYVQRTRKEIGKDKFLVESLFSRWGEGSEHHERY